MTADPHLDSPVLQSVPLGDRWQTLDPFLFCAHHKDAYPSGNARLGPQATLEGRQLGQDFAGIDGWNMYHGRQVPGFPQHPHRGFETITYVRQGLCDHSDSMGAAARFGRGDVQWMTAGSGVVHSEMFPLLDRDLPNDLHLFQIWLNLPASDKLVDPYFTMLWSEDIPRVERTDANGHTTEVTVIAGSFGEAEPLEPPPDSWAAKPGSDVAVWHVSMPAGASFELPAAGSESGRVIYVFEGHGLEIDGHAVDENSGNAVVPARALDLTATAGPIEALVLQGRPLAEPVAQYGPFVMNTEDEIRQAILDYQQTGFGGWPWETDDPDHGPSRSRFARHADGRLEEKS
jgi:hypothetical protein